MKNQHRFGRYRGIFRIPPFFRSQGSAAGHSSSSTEKDNKIESPDDGSREQETGIIIRKACLIDRSFVVSLGKQLFNIYGPYEGAVSRWFDHETTATFIAELDRRRVGFIMLGALGHRWETPVSFELLAIGLCPAGRRKGIGNRLMETLENHAAHQGLDRIFLHTAVRNYPAQQLFYKRGYRPWGLKPQFYPAGQDAIVMSKKIQEAVSEERTG